MEALMSDKKFLIHVCVEVAIIGCVSFWLYSKISNKDDIIAKLEKENAELRQRVERIEAFLQQFAMPQPLQGDPSAAPATQRSSKKKKHSPTTSKDEGLVEKSSDDEEIEL